MTPTPSPSPNDCLAAFPDELVVPSGTSSGIVSSISARSTAAQASLRAKVRANRLRRTADRRGLALRKSRRRDPRATDYDRWTIVDLATGEVVAGTGPSGRPHFTLDAVANYLDEGERAQTD
jgi:hypothetical protein